MSQENKRAKLKQIQTKISSIIYTISQIEYERLHLIETAEIYETELAELQQKETKLLAKIKSV